MEAEKAAGDFFGKGAVILARGGGTASPKFIVEAGGVKYLLKKRREEFSGEKTILFDHSVILRLKEAGLPVAPPLKARNSGLRAIRSGAEAWEAFRFMEGLEDFREGNPAQTADAGRTLGRMHRALKEFRPEGEKPWKREFHPENITRELRNRAGTITGFNGSILSRLFKELRLLAENQDSKSLSHTIVHGDYTSANLKFKKDAAGGIFDFDWAVREAALYDIARGLAYFAAGRDKPVDGGDILSLVQPFRIIPERAGLFLRAYTQECSLSKNDIINLPRALKEFFIGCRVRALRKVPDSRKPELLDEGLLRVLDDAEKLGLRAYLAESP